MCIVIHSVQQIRGYHLGVQGYHRRDRGIYVVILFKEGGVEVGKFAGGSAQQQKGEGPFVIYVSFHPATAARFVQVGG